jgi:hypothetical protein
MIFPSLALSESGESWLTWVLIFSWRALKAAAAFLIVGEDRQRHVPAAAAQFASDVVEDKAELGIRSPAGGDGAPAELYHFSHLEVAAGQALISVDIVDDGVVLDLGFVLQVVFGGAAALRHAGR